MTKSLLYVSVLCLFVFAAFEIITSLPPRYPDADGDGAGNSDHPSHWWFLKSEPYVANKTDCNDDIPLFNTLDEDRDGYTSCQGDCNDAMSLRHPGAAEVCNNLDDDCDSEVDEGVDLAYYPDADKDRYGNVARSERGCSIPSGYTDRVGDCDDMDDSVHPNGAEIVPGDSNHCSDGRDNDCNGKADADDEACQDVDADAIPNGEDAIYTYDLDGDKKHDVLCVTIALAMKPPWSFNDVYVLASPPLGASDHFNGPLDPLRKLRISQENIPGRPNAWCMDFRPLPSGTYMFLLVSETDKSGGPASVSDCRDWVTIDLSAFCKTHAGRLELYCSRMDERNACGQIDWVIRADWRNRQLWEPEPI